jgi:hypothetical protein
VGQILNVPNIVFAAIFSLAGPHGRLTRGAGTQTGDTIAPRRPPGVTPALNGRLAFPPHLRRLLVVPDAQECGMA